MGRAFTKIQAAGRAKLWVRRLTACASHYKVAVDLTVLAAVPTLPPLVHISNGALSKFGLCGLSAKAIRT